MVEYSRPAWVGGRRARRAVGKFAMTTVVAVTAFMTSAWSVQEPIPHIDVAFAAPEIPVTLSFAGNDVLVTGAINAMFKDSVFVGPNRSEKRGRLRSEIDGLAIANTFAAARQQMAQLRMPPSPNFSGTKHLDSAPRMTEAERIAIASIDPQAAFAALEAIEGISGSAGPMPLTESPTLAYARANAPATGFSTATSMTVAQKQFECLATAIYFEARGESYRGQAAVAQVVLNRVKHSAYPNTICGVVYQNKSKRNACQFSFACDGIPEKISEPEPWRQAKEIAEKVLSGEIYLTEVANATHYHATYVSPRWAPRLKKMAKIGLHIFYRFKSSNG